MKPQPPSAPKQTRPPRGQKAPTGSDVSKALALGCALASGCTGPWVRPEPFTCPAGAIATREQLRWTDRQHISLLLDDRHNRFEDVWLRPGDTVVGVVDRDYWDKDWQLGERLVAPKGTRFLGGKVYVVPEKTETGRPGRVFVKYERVKLPQQEELPVCFIVEESAIELRDGAAKTAVGTNGISVDYWP